MESSNEDAGKYITNFHQSTYIFLPKEHRKLVDAISKQNLELLQLILSEQKDDMGPADLNSALLLCVTSSQPKLAELLIKYGANVHAYDSCGSLLQAAVAKSDSEMTKLLLKHSSKSEKMRYMHAGLLSVVKTDNNKEMLLLLSRESIDAGLLNHRYPNRTLLHTAVVVLATKKRRQDGLEKEGFTYTHQGLDIECIQRLIDLGCDVTVGDTDGRLPLHDAAAAGDHNLVNVLLKQNLKSICVYDRDFIMPWMEAIQSANDHTLASKLLDMDQVHVVSDDSYMMLAASSGSQECVEFLLAKGVNPCDGYERCQSTPVIAACESGQIETTLLLVKYSSKIINFRSETGRTALQSALEQYNSKDNHSVVNLLDTLVAYGADVTSLTSSLAGLKHFCMPHKLDWILKHHICLNVDEYLDNGVDLFRELVTLLCEHTADAECCVILIKLLNYGMKMTYSTCQSAKGHGRNPITVAFEYKKPLFAFALYASGCRYDECLDSLLIQNDALLESLFYILSVKESTFPHLQELARIAVIGTVRPGFLPDLIPTLPIPKRLKEYLDWSTYLDHRHWSTEKLGKAKHSEKDFYEALIKCLKAFEY